MDIRTDLHYSQTGYDVTNYFQSEVIAKNYCKYNLRQLQVEFLQNSLSEDHEILQASRGHLASLNTAQKCVKRVRQAALNNSATV